MYSLTSLPVFFSSYLPLVFSVLPNSCLSNPMLRSWVFFWKYWFVYVTPLQNFVLLLPLRKLSVPYHGNQHLPPLTIWTLCVIYCGIYSLKLCSCHSKWLAVTDVPGFCAHYGSPFSVKVLLMTESPVPILSLCETNPSWIFFF